MSPNFEPMCETTIGFQGGNSQQRERSVKAAAQVHLHRSRPLFAAFSLTLGGPRRNLLLGPVSSDALPIHSTCCVTFS
ncbi:hypothetical protein Mal15_66890 [Stieleria maiorica]|uniref:Uncharacterized protein n=1 Tax=Stieleria maiorica TaxID=2795974 RepID=A0A5B9MU36_9BACT|nr:hypothetical protein Mal15_66890 [Stieleria maiorica]